MELSFDTGQRVRVNGSGLIGRNPTTSNPDVTCTAVTDPDMSVSKVHIEYGMDAEGLWVKDRGSTNGSAIIHAGMAPVTLTPGQTVHVVIGDTVIFGHRRFTVEEVRLP